MVFLTWSQVKWADIEIYAEFLSKEMPDIKIDDNCLFEVEIRLNVHLNSNELEQFENPHDEKLKGIFFLLCPKLVFSPRVDSPSSMVWNPVGLRKSLIGSIKVSFDV
ncbi:hypothetical protein TNCV_2906011 [Trichonephila clavipes]|nr:hypothetical protein TNCV_2906011 [Trichonephila clavipes]